MRKTGGGPRALTAAVAVTLMTFSVGFSYAVADDFAQREVLPRGTTVGGYAVGGLPRDEAIARLRRKLETPLLAPVTVDARGKRLVLDPRPLVRIDVAALVDKALAPQRRTTVLQRVYYRVTNAEAGIAVPAEVRIDVKGLRSWAARTGKAVNERPADSKLSVAGDGLRISKSKVGWRLDEAASVSAVQGALTGGQRMVKLPMKQVQPRVTERSFARTLLVRLGERRLYLFNQARRVKSYPIAVGMPEFPTPKGWWRIDDKQVNPTWTNPGSAWAAGMPAFIPGGSGNPLGTRALLLDASGVAIHGTSNDGSIGTAASHACMRMHMWDVEDLFPRVEVGDRVIIAP